MNDFFERVIREAKKIPPPPNLDELLNDIFDFSCNTIENTGENDPDAIEMMVYDEYGDRLDLFLSQIPITRNKLSKKVSKVVQDAVDQCFEDWD